MINNHLKGKFGEIAAARYLREKGYDIIDANYKTHYGELDLVAQKGSIIVFAEVKLRTSERFGSPISAVDYDKQKRIVSTSRYWKLSHPMLGTYTYRYDVIEIFAKSEGGRMIVEKIVHHDRMYAL